MNKSLLVKSAYIKLENNDTYIVRQYEDHLCLEFSPAGDREFYEVRISPVLNSFIKLIQWYKAVENIKFIQIAYRHSKEFLKVRTI